MKLNRGFVLNLLIGFMVVVIFFQLATTQTQVIGTGFNSGSSDNQAPGTTSTVGIQGFDGTNWDRLGAGTVGGSNLSGTGLKSLSQAFWHSESFGTQAMFGNDRTGLATVRSVMYNSVDQHRAFQAHVSVTNPAANEDLLNITVNSNYVVFDHVVLSTNAAASIEIVAVDSSGATCTTVTPTNIYFSGPVASNQIVNRLCTTDPTAIRVINRIDLAANSAFTVDSQGWFDDGTGGISVRVVGAVTGVVTATVRYYQN